MIEERWAEEELFWTAAGAEARRRLMPSSVLLTDAGPLQGEAITAALDRAPRCESVVMQDKVAVETEGCMVLAYRATARLTGGGEALALCSSTWLRQDDGWGMILHQRAPLPAGE